MKTSYDDQTKTMHLEGDFEGIEFEQYLDLCRYLRGIHAQRDPLEDAIRPYGTPISDRHRELEDAAEASGGEVVVTHAAGGKPLLVTRADEPIGVPVATPTPDVVATVEEVEPDAVPEPDVSPEVVDAEQQSEHAQRWRGVAKYGNQSIRGFVVKPGYVVVLELESGEKVHLDFDDNEIRREPGNLGLPQHESRDGDFRPNDTPVEAAQPEIVAPNLPEWPTGLPAGIKSSDVKVRDIVQAFVDHQGGGKGKDFAMQVVDNVSRVSGHLRKFDGIEETEVRRRVVQLLSVVGVLSHQECQDLKAEVG